MIIKTKTLQENCKKILDALDNNPKLIITETLELKAVENTLYLNVTNMEYFVSVKMPLEEVSDLHAVVNAKLFLGLVSKITTSTIDLQGSDTFLTVKANGTYKLPYIFEGNTMISLKRIVIDNVTNELVIPNSVLQSILKYNNKELMKSGSTGEVKRLFYVDDKGCLTFANGACVNTFSLSQPIIMYLTEKTVKLFKLFKSDNVKLSLGCDLVGDNMLTKVCFQDDNTCLTSILNTSEKVVNTFPVSAIRGLADSKYEHSIVLDKNILLDAIERLSLFSGENDLYVRIIFGTESLEASDMGKINKETITYVTACESLEDKYETVFDVNDLKLTLESCDEQYVTLRFGNKRAIVLERTNVKNIIPESVRRI